MKMFFSALYNILAFIGFLLLIAAIAAVVYDVRGLKSKIEPGKVFRKKEADKEFLVRRGFILDTFYECHNGYVKISVFRTKWQVYYKQLTAEQKTAYKPDALCQSKTATTPATPPAVKPASDNPAAN